MAKEKKQTHIKIDIEDKEALEVIRDENGFASMAVVIKKMIKYCNGKKL